VASQFNLNHELGGNKMTEKVKDGRSEKVKAYMDLVNAFLREHPYQPPPPDHRSCAEATFQAWQHGIITFKHMQEIRAKRDEALKERFDDSQLKQPWIPYYRLHIEGGHGKEHAIENAKVSYEHRRTRPNYVWRPREKHTP
jgi:LmbE family N-acetylglucosaminyl deacetylase